MSKKEPSLIDRRSLILSLFKASKEAPVDDEVVNVPKIASKEEQREENDLEEIQNLSKKNRHKKKQQGKIRPRMGRR